MKHSLHCNQQQPRDVCDPFCGSTAFYSGEAPMQCFRHGGEQPSPSRWSICIGRSFESHQRPGAIIDVRCVLSQFVGFSAFHGHRQILLASSLSGVVRMRKLKKLPNKKCWFVGYSEMDAVYATSKFNKSWETDLTISHHDCRNYVNGLVEQLTGEIAVLERLQKSSNTQVSEQDRHDGGLWRFASWSYGRVASPSWVFLPLSRPMYDGRSWIMGHYICKVYGWLGIGGYTTL